MKAKRYRYARVFRTIFTFLGYDYDRFSEEDKVLTISLKRTRKTATCPKCHRRNRLSKEYYQRTIKDLNVGPLECYITFWQNKLHCKCGFRGFEDLTFVRNYSRCSIRYEEYVFLLCQQMTISDTSKLTHLDWKTVKDIDIHYTIEMIETLETMNPNQIGVDEIAYEKGHKYLTVVRNAETNKVIWIGKERKESTLNSFFEALGANKCNNITKIVMDMWDPYIASVNNYCPHAEIIFDKFHIMKSINQAVDDIRKVEFAKAEDNQRKDMKKKRFLILRRRKDLTGPQIETLDDIMSINDNLYRAYLMKEHIADIFDDDNYEECIKRLDIWKENVLDTGLKPLIRCMKMIINYEYGIRNYFKNKITNAGSEGINTKINIIRRKAYGYADLDYFMLKIYQACGVTKS